MATVLTVSTAGTSSESAGERDDDRGATSGFLPALRSAERSIERAESARVRATTVMGTELSVRSDGALDWGGALPYRRPDHHVHGRNDGRDDARARRHLDRGPLSVRRLVRADERRVRPEGRRLWPKYVYRDLDDLGGTHTTFAVQMRNTAPNRSVKLLLDSEDVRRVGVETASGQRAEPLEPTHLNPNPGRAP